MGDFERVVQDCNDYILPKFIEISSKAQNVLQTPLEITHFNNELINFQWEAISESKILDENLDLLIDLTLKRIISEILMSSYDSNETITDMSLKEKLQLCSVILDFTFFSKDNRKSPKGWTATYFDLLSTVIDLLSWPNDITEFWDYPESRIDWFKMNDVNQEDYEGVSNLVSYRAPLSESLRHWNELLQSSEDNSKFNTPLHYKMKYRLGKFLSDLLPIYEESNFNRSAQFSKHQDSGNQWNKVRLSGRPNSTQEIFADDFLYVFDRLIVDPINFTFKAAESKINLDKALSPLLDIIFDSEDIFYKTIKSNCRGVSTINTKLNQNYQANFKTIVDKEPRFLKTSEVFQNSKKDLWEEIISLSQETSSTIRPTCNDLSLLNPNTLFKQMIHTENDFYRKQFILQIFTVSTLVDKIINSADVRNFYKGTYDKENEGKIFDFESLDENNIKKTNGIYNHLCKSRITNFYLTRDPHFSNIIKSILDSDDRYLLAKIDGFKSFQNFSEKKGIQEDVEIDSSFKKFGFIKLGNKQINNVWKIKTGVDSIVNQSTDPNALYSKLREDWENRNAEDNQPKEEIVKQWKTLRSLRSQYLTEFNKLNEGTGISGLFDSTIVEYVSGQRKEFRDTLSSKVDEEHQTKLMEARKYFEEKTTLKRKREE